MNLKRFKVMSINSGAYVIVYAKNSFQAAEDAHNEAHLKYPVRVWLVNSFGHEIETSISSFSK